MYEKAELYRQRRAKQEQKAIERLVKTVGDVFSNDTLTQSRLEGFFNSLHAEWFNAAMDEAAQDTREELTKSGIRFTITHKSGDNSYPTEYGITYGNVSVIGPTFDLALIEFIQKLVKPVQTNDSEIDRLAYIAYKAEMEVEGDPLVFKWEKLGEEYQNKYRAIVQAILSGQIRK